MKELDFSSAYVSDGREKETNICNPDADVVMPSSFLPFLFLSENHVCAEGIETACSMVLIFA